MKHWHSKIVFILLIALTLNSCNVVKRVGENDHLIVKNTIKVNEKTSSSEALQNLVYQKTNRKLATIPLRLYIYNLARPNIDSIINTKIDSKQGRRKKLERFLSKKQLNRYIKSRVKFNNWLKTIGEAPTILDSALTKKTVKRLRDYYVNYGWFNAEVDYDIKFPKRKRAEVTYNITSKTPYIVDSIQTTISSPVVDSIYKANVEKSLIKTGRQYKTNEFLSEEKRLANLMRNSGVYHFSQDYIYYVMDTIGRNNNVKVDLQITDRKIKSGDTTLSEAFQQYKVKTVNIFTNETFDNADEKITDSTTYNGYKFYSKGPLKYRPKAITNALFLEPGNWYSDLERSQTSRRLSNLQVFKYPNISYTENADTTLTANILLTPLKKFKLGFSAEASTSNIQTIGFSASPSLLIRNLFHGAETLEISGVASIGASKDAANNRDRFFDINEIGADLKLTIPRIFFPFNTDRIIKKDMLGTTRITLSTTNQTNIGLDKQTFNGVFNYNWKPSNRTINSFDLFNIQFVKNLNTANYFNEYTSSYNTLNNIAVQSGYIDVGQVLGVPDQADQFIDDVLAGNINTTTNNYQSVANINERKDRLTEDNLIISSAFNYTLDKREGAFDNDYSIFRVRGEIAGNTVSALSGLLNLKKNSDGKRQLFNVAYSQYFKTELDYIKHWDLNKGNIIALRNYFGIAIPYGNSGSIPFIKSFFAGGANDNRAWSAYNLGPGSSGSLNEFNEANLKIAANLEYRFNFFGQLNGALFTDIGNIWNVLDDEDDQSRTFTGIKSLSDIAIGSGIGLRYDFKYLVFRFDIGFKTYDPVYEKGNRWFNDYNFSNAVYNIGINYPF